MELSSINSRGDVDILKPGLAMFEDLTGKPVLRVLFQWKKLMWMMRIVYLTA